MSARFITQLLQHGRQREALAQLELMAKREDTDRQARKGAVVVAFGLGAVFGALCSLLARML